MLKFTPVIREMKTLLKNKIQPSKFEILIGFIKQFMHQATSLLSNRVFLGVAQHGRFL